MAEMTYITSRGWSWCVGAVALLCVVTNASWADETLYPGYTKPSESRDVTFNGPGVVSEEPVKEGDVVTAGQLLALQDTVLEEAAVKVAEVEANSTLQIDAAKADHAAKLVELKRKEEMRKDNVVGESELEEAKVDEVIAAIRIQLAEQEKQKAMAEAVQEQAKIKLKTLNSPVAGVVSKINTHIGEAASSDTTKPVMTIIQNDPLYVEVEMPTSVVRTIHKQETMEMRYVGEDKWQQGQVIFIAPEADARSDRQKVRLQLANTDGRQSGLQVQVRAPEAVATAASTGN